MADNELGRLSSLKENPVSREKVTDLFRKRFATPDHDYEPEALTEPSHKFT